MKLNSIFQHYSESLKLRTYLFSELLKAKKTGLILPKGVFINAWKDPHHHEEYIWLLRFMLPGEKITVIDIGGNSGYWAKRFLYYFPGSTVYAFEPVMEMYKQYVERFKDNKDVTVYNNALGDQEEERNIHVAKDFGLTSFNYYTDDLEKMNLNFQKEENVKIKRLDQFYKDIYFNKTIIKVDVQGFETKVVKGGKDVFKMADLTIMECSFINEYKGQLPTFGELVSLLRELGLHPICFGVFDRTKGPIAFERNVLFVKEKYFSKIWG